MPYVSGTRGAVAEDLAGKAFSMLTVLARDTTRTRRAYWNCRCECGQLKSVAACELKSGRTKSCGCYDRHRKRTETVTHGLAGTPTYNCWSNMHARCTNQKRHDYKNYGGRGISVCERWQVFENFLADMGMKPKGLSIDRIDNNGTYEPANCRWATSSEQRKNQRAAAEIGRASTTQASEKP